MMVKTKRIYHDFVDHKTEPEDAFKGNYPIWPLMDKISDSWITRILFGTSYVAFYYFLQLNGGCMHYCQSIF